MKQKIGFLVLKSGGNEEARYLYPTVLYHLALRSRIKRELETGKVLRCCCREDETEVTVNENLELQFLRGRHAAACVEYVRQLAKYSKAAGVIPFIYGRGFSIPVAFKCKKGARKEAGIYSGEALDLCKWKRFDLTALNAIIAARAFEMCVQTGQMTADAVLSQMEYEYGLYQYEDLDGAPISINSSLVLTRRAKIGETAFFCGKVRKISDQYGARIYLICENDYGNFNISLPRVKWEKLTSAMCRSDCVVCCITGFVREKEIIPFKKGHYDKITKTSTAGKQEAKRVLEFASFTLFYLNEYGLIGGSELADGSYLKEGTLYNQWGSEEHITDQAAMGMALLAKKVAPTMTAFGTGYAFESVPFLMNSTQDYIMLHYSEFLQALQRPVRPWIRMDLYVKEQNKVPYIPFLIYRTGEHQEEETYKVPFHKEKQYTPVDWRGLCND